MGPDLNLPAARLVMYAVLAVFASAVALYLVSPFDEVDRDGVPSAENPISAQAPVYEVARVQHRHYPSSPTADNPPGFRTEETSFLEQRQGWEDLQSRLRSMPAEELLVKMLDGVQRDKQVMNFSNRELVARVRGGDAAVLDAIQDRFDSMKPSEKAYTAVALGRMGTPGAVGLILELLEKRDRLPEMAEQYLIKALSDIPVSTETDAQLIFEQLVFAAETTFLEVIDVRRALLFGMAHFGTVDATRYLMGELNDAGVHDDAVVSAISAMRSLSAVEAFSGMLMADKDLEDSKSIVAGNALSTMGMPEATSALLGWAESADEEALEQALSWLSNSSDTRSWEQIYALARSARYAGTPLGGGLDFIVEERDKGQPLLTGPDVE